MKVKRKGGVRKGKEKVKKEGKVQMHNRTARELSICSPQSALAPPIKF